MNHVRVFLTTLLVAVLVGSGIAYHFNTVKEYKTCLTLATNAAATVALENVTLATKNAQLEEESEYFLVIAKRAVIICGTLVTSGFASYEQTEVTLAYAEDLQAQAALTNGAEIEVEKLQAIVDMLRATRNTLREGFIEDLNIDDVLPLPLEDQPAVVPDDDLYTGRYHTRKRTG